MLVNAKCLVYSSLPKMSVILSLLFSGAAHPDPSDKSSVVIVDSHATWVSGFDTENMTVTVGLETPC